jgi:predicted ester cyclase
MEIDMTRDPSEIRAFAERYTASWCSMDPVTVVAHYASEGSLAINGGAPAVGRDAITAVAASFYEALPDMQVYFDDLVVDRDRIEYHWTFTGTNTGPGGTGNAVRVKGFESRAIDEDGLIAASIGSYDAEEYARQLAEGV